MIHETIPIQTEGSADYAQLTTYIWDYSEALVLDKRPLILVCPGGGYTDTSASEADVVALRFVSMGFHAAVLRYSVAPVRYPVALKEVALSMALLRKNREKWRIQEDKIAIMGFSAGGHLAADYCVSWNQAFLAQAAGCAQEDLCPNSLLLCYPVITGDPRYRHEGSFQALLGENFTEEWAETLSLEKQVGPQVPRTFIWNTFTDNAVPPENSLLFASALMAHRIPVEFHLYERGRHGLSLADETTAYPGIPIQTECQSWVELAKTWLKNM